jgi:hypothetical protein
MCSNIEKINDHFKLPIFYNDQKMELNKNIVKDLELVESIDPSQNPLYMHTFQPKTEFGKKVIEQISIYYTTDKQFLKDSQQLVKGYKPIIYPSINIIDVWDEIKNDTNFKEKYGYISWDILEHLNKSDAFLQLTSMYNIISPILSLCAPFIMLIIPFFIIKMKGLHISIPEYITILKDLLSNHAIGKLFTKFNTVDIGEKMYILLSAAFYIFSIYNNVVSCIRFNKNMVKIHSYLELLKTYIENTEKTVVNFLLYTEKLETYKTFNKTLVTKITVLTNLKHQLEKINPYTLSVKKVGELGKVLKCFYTIYTDDELNDAFLYSFGFNGYIDNLTGLTENVIAKNIQMAKFTTKKSKNKNIFKDIYYPALVNNNPVKNSVKLNKNIIITGPNASGKTTVLKTVLINIIITQQFGCGFYKSAVLNPYKWIHCYLNIPDTSGRDSLFQAEARRCKDILDIIDTGLKSEKKSSSDSHFCVFDELYSGTNPEEAILAATAFLNYLTKYKNVDCILTTHFIDLCTQLDKNKNIVNFHMKTEKIKDDFKYTYLLEKGISDVHGGIKVLNDMNYPKEIIDNASKK